MEPKIRDLSLYIHIPFCKAKCIYCDFLSFGGCDYSLQREYVRALIGEIKAYERIAGKYRVQTIFIGGGTPSYMDADQIVEMLEAVYQVFDVDEKAEITIEGNPDSLIRDRLAAYRRAGINRLSIGLQSANDEVLKMLGRVHNYDQFIAAYYSARQEGFDNINVDLMSGLPGESVSSYIHTLGKVAKLSPEHISAYSLIVEEGTLLSAQEELLSLLPSEEEDRKLYAKTKLLLKNSGYQRYEISNYAKKGFACRHNLVYWMGGEYLGLGLGASSCLALPGAEGLCQKVRFRGVEDMEEYGRLFRDCGVVEEAALPEFIRTYYRETVFLQQKDEMEEFMFLGLRCREGIRKDVFLQRFGTTVDKVYGKIIEKYKEQGFLEEQGERIFLNDRGVDVSNVIMAEFLL